VSVKITLDISAFTDSEKKGVGNGLALALHEQSCEGVKAMWSVDGGSMKDCLLGKSPTEGISFGMAMLIDSKLMTEQPDCASVEDCYGGPYESRRQLAAVDLENKGDFDVKIAGAALASDTDYTADATKAISEARSGGAFQPAAVQASLKKAMNRTSVRNAVGAKLAVIQTAAATATVESTAAAVATITAAPTTAAPTTSNTYTAGAVSALMLMAGVFLF